MSTLHGLTTGSPSACCGRNAHSAWANIITLERLAVESQIGGYLLTFSLEGEGGRYGWMRGLHLPGRLGVPHPPLRGTFSRGEKVEPEPSRSSI